MKHYFVSYTETITQDGISICSGEPIFGKYSENRHLALKDKHPFEWQKEKNNGKTKYNIVGITSTISISIISWQEISEEEYNLHENV